MQFFKNSHPIHQEFSDSLGFLSGPPVGKILTKNTI